jgi:hypothetical protein
MYRLHHQVDMNRRAKNVSSNWQPKGVFRSVLRLLVAANVVPSSPILVTMMMEAIRSCKMPDLKTVMRRNISEEGILHSHRCENLKS